MRVHFVSVFPRRMKEETGGMMDGIIGGSPGHCHRLQYYDMISQCITGRADLAARYCT